MKILFHLVHPAHYHFFNPIFKILKNSGWDILITIRNKDVLENLLSEVNINFVKITNNENRTGKLSLLVSMLKKTYGLLKISKEFRPNLIVSSAPEAAITGKLLGIPSILCFEDDLEYVKSWAYLSGPLASVFLCPESCSAYKWEYKTIKYNGYQELTYLHPKYFENIKNKNNKTKTFLIRLASLTAYHDENNNGIEDNVALKIINKLKQYGDVYISAERELPSELEKLRLKIKSSELLEFMSGIDLYLGDSQTMAAEAAILGVPSLRYNSFVGKLGYLNELEYKYNLTYGINPAEPENLFSKIDELLKTDNLKIEWQKKRKAMLAEKIDVTAFMVWFIENYPKSFKIMKENPDYQYNFR